MIVLNEEVDHVTDPAWSALRDRLRVFFPNGYFPESSNGSGFVDVSIPKFGSVRVVHDGDSFLVSKRNGSKIITLRELEDALTACGSLAVADEIMNKRASFVDGFVNARQLAEMELPEPVWVVPGILPEGLSILAGPPKVGKSWLALSVSLAVAHGGTALGSIDVDPGSVIYLGLEDTLRRLQNRLKMLSEDGVPFPENLFFRTEAPRTDEGLLDLLNVSLDQKTDCRLIVIDTLARIRPPRRQGADVYLGDSVFAASLQKIASERSLGLTAVHHTRKAQADDFVEEVSGSFGLTGTADTVLLLRRSRSEATATLHITGRDIDERDLALDFDKTRGQWRILGDADKWALTPERRKILEALEKSPESMTPKEIYEETGIPYESVKQLLGKMLDSGGIKKTGFGKYTVESQPSINGSK